MNEQQITPVYCQSCGVAIGKYCSQDGRVMLEVGPVVLEAAHGFCKCGAEWHWSSSEQKLLMLIDRLLKMSNDINSDND